MRRALFLFFVLAALLFPIISLGRHKAAVRPYTLRSHAQAVVAVYTLDGGKCSGWVVGENLVMTAGHCIDYRYERVLVGFEDGTSEAVFTAIKFLHQGAETADDLALLSGPTHKIVPLKLGGFPHLERAWCLAVGYGGTEVPAIQQQTICRTFPELDKGGLMVIAGRIIPGDSGGPILDEADHVIGMVKARETHDLPILWAVPASRIQTFLEK
jgi:hypothetical protein